MMKNHKAPNTRVIDNPRKAENHCDEEISSSDSVLIECVLKMLDNSILKLQIALLIPMFLSNLDILNQYLPKSDIAAALKYYNDYLCHADSEHDISIPDSLIELVDLFWEHQTILDIVPNYVSDIPSEFMVLVNALQKLRGITEIRLRKTAAFEKRQEKIFHRINKDNMNVVTSIAEQSKELKGYQVRLRFKITAKKALIKKYEDDLATRKWDNNLKIKQEILKSHERIQEHHNASLKKQKILAEEVHWLREAYKKELEANLIAEKEARDEKNVLLNELLALIKKYDKNIGEKIEEKSELENIYDNKTKLMDKFRIDYNLKEIEYTKAAEMKMIEENEEFERNLMLFMTNRAAKIIQHYWRRYWKIKITSKSSRHGKRKKDRK